MGTGGRAGLVAVTPGAEKDHCSDGGESHLLLLDLCQPPLAGTALLWGRRGSTAGRGSSSGRALGQPCSACMGAETHKTDKLAAPLSQISKVNRPLPAGDWVTLGNPTLPAVNLPTIPLFTLLTLFTGKKYPAGF